MSACEEIWKNTLVKMSNGNINCMGPIGPTGPSTGSTANYTGTGFFGPGFANAGTITPDVLPVVDAISLLRNPSTYYPTQFGLGIYDNMNYSDVVMIGNHVDMTGPNSAQGAIAIGNLAGQVDQGSEAIAIGSQAGYCGQGPISVAVGSYAGSVFQGESSVHIGVGAGQYESFGTSIGIYSGYEFQAPTAIGIGTIAGALGQNDGAVAIGIGAQTYNSGDNTNSIAIGQYCGTTSQYADAIAIGNSAGYENQGESAVAIGNSAGYYFQGSGSVAIGYNSGDSTQDINSVAIGNFAGNNFQGQQCVAIGNDAGNTSQSLNAIAIGESAGYTNQGSNAIALGYQAGFASQGTYAIAIGSHAGTINQAANSIVINATGSDLENTIANSCVIAPIRNVTGSTDPYLFYDDTTGELTYGIPPSSRDRKTDIQSLTENVVDKLLRLSPVSFNYKESKRKTFGLVAEQVVDVLPEICIHHSVTGELDGIEYTELIGPMIKLIQLNDNLLKENDILLDKISCH